jgi:hypothetical protein
MVYARPIHRTLGNEGAPRAIVLGKLRALARRDRFEHRADRSARREKGTIWMPDTIASGPLDTTSWPLRPISNVNCGAHAAAVINHGVRYDATSETCGVTKTASLGTSGARFAHVLGMPSVRTSVGVALLLLAACQKGDDSDSKNLEHTLRWTQGPNTEIQDCHIFKLDNADPLEIERIRIKFPPGSHHVHMYRSETPEPDSVADCWSGIDWTHWHLVLGAQTQAMDWKLPEGLTVPLDAHQQLLVQVHWLNTTEAPIDGKVDITFHTTERSDAHVGVMFGINKQTAMEAHERKTIAQWCPMPEGSKLLAIMGHYHGLGQRYQVSARPENVESESGLRPVVDSGDVIYQALGEQTFQFKPYEPPYQLKPGDGLEFQCEYFNYRNHPISWGADVENQEHCNLSAYYYPADGSSFCFIEKPEVATIAGPTAAVMPRDELEYTVTLNMPADEGGALVKLIASVPGVLELPDSVKVQKGSTSAKFKARALQPARVIITALLGSTYKTVQAKVGGLALSEVHAGETGQTDQRQWVELSNLSDVAIDLSRYSLGAGNANYARMKLQLAGTLPPKGCVVVGGPQPTVTNQPPYDQVADFDPDLGLGSGAAYGVALFDFGIDKITSKTLPFDALVYGDDNNVLVGPDGQLAAPVARPPANGTYYRTAESRWTTQAAATPRICEVR